jgi:hypothetical protein
MGCAQRAPNISDFEFRLSNFSFFYVCLTFSMASVGTQARDPSGNVQ